MLYSFWSPSKLSFPTGVAYCPEFQPGHLQGLGINLSSSLSSFFFILLWLEEFPMTKARDASVVMGKVFVGAGVGALRKVKWKWGRWKAECALRRTPHLTLEFLTLPLTLIWLSPLFNMTAFSSWLSFLQEQSRFLQLPFLYAKEQEPHKHSVNSCSINEETPLLFTPIMTSI